eukprot:CAMPEP_0194300014 /NCGR_PEP_ID=MMETSP0169-20130528/61024_1 /TAXON_ID=218684 /ORGANISM="Corethron pennatum, Strain L29A3" /LENGTH=754 /DNA_ID=CAMNT_0039050149 /DNA_START=278 /DNA_END=2543 /DNA_ORIENTATION=+
MKCSLLELNKHHNTHHDAMELVNRSVRGGRTTKVGCMRVVSGTMNTSLNTLLSQEEPVELSKNKKEKIMKSRGVEKQVPTSLTGLTFLPPPRSSSKVWDFFSLIDPAVHPNFPNHCRCGMCGTVMKYVTPANLANLNKHLKTQHSEVMEEHSILWVKNDIKRMKKDEMIRAEINEKNEKKNQAANPTDDQRTEAGHSQKPTPITMDDIEIAGHSQKPTPVTMDDITAHSSVPASTETELTAKPPGILYKGTAYLHMGDANRAQHQYSDARADEAPEGGPIVWRVEESIEPAIVRHPDVEARAVTTTDAGETEIMQEDDSTKGDGGTGKCQPRKKMKMKAQKGLGGERKTGQLTLTFLPAPPRSNSRMWNFFSRIDHKSFPNRFPNHCLCNLCGAIMKYQTPANLANLNKHLKTQHLAMMKDSMCDLPAGQTKIGKRRHSVIDKDKTSAPSTRQYKMKKSRIIDERGREGTVSARGKENEAGQMSYPANIGLKEEKYSDTHMSRTMGDTTTYSSDSSSIKVEQTLGIIPTGMVHPNLKDTNGIFCKSIDVEADEAPVGSFSVRRLKEAVGTTVMQCQNAGAQVGLEVRPAADRSAAEFGLDDDYVRTWLDRHTVLELDGRARCSFSSCRKLFKNKAFLYKHLCKKHFPFVVEEGECHNGRMEAPYTNTIPKQMTFNASFDQNYTDEIKNKTIEASVIIGETKDHVKKVTDPHPSPSKIHNYLTNTSNDILYKDIPPPLMATHDGEIDEMDKIYAV